MKLKTTAALVAALVGLAGLATTTVHAETRVDRAIALADACVPPGMVGADFQPAATCTEEQRKETIGMVMEIAILLSQITANDKMTTDAIRECTAANSEVSAMTACLKVKTEAMDWLSATLPTFDFHQQLIFGGCALDNGTAVKAEVDLVATVACYKAHA